MKKSIYAFLICLTIICTAMTCDDDEGETVRISLVNNSNETIWLTGFYYCDTTTLLEPNKVFQIQDPINELKIGNTYDLGDCMYLDQLEQGFKFQIIIFKQSTLDKYPNRELISKNIYDKLYVLSYEDLEALNYQVVYTGK